MKALTCTQMARLERRAIEEAGIPAEQLMERAGAGVARAVERLARLAPPGPRHCLLVAGKGNNGGDAFVAARLLQTSGFHVAVTLTAPATALQGAAAHHFHLMAESGAHVAERPLESDWNTLRLFREPGARVVVDGLLGTGLQGPARGVAARAIEHVNLRGQQDPVVAIDIPSGLNADSGAAEGPAVRADLTVTMGYPKRGLLQPCALDFVGNVELVDIGIPSSYGKELEAELEMIAVPDLVPLVTRRPRQAHKGGYGHVLIVAGSHGMSGAAGLAARAALRSGAGLVSVLTPAGVAPTVAAMAPEAMVHAGAETDGGGLAADSLRSGGPDLDVFDAILLGPGLGVGPGTQALVEQVLDRATVPIALDADALNVCAGHAETVRRARAPVVVAPHPGEMARLLGCSTAEVQADRIQAAWQAEQALNSFVVLKGAGTLVCRHGHKLQVNMTGNPGMACGGMGDALAGLLAGLLAQKLAPFDAARLAVWLHGCAGDHAALAKAKPGLTASDLIEAFPSAWKDIGAR